MAALPEFCLAALVLMSLVLPLYAAARLRPIPAVRRPYLAAVWAGQTVIAAAALLITATNADPVVCVGVGGAGCALGGLVFRGQCLRPGTITGRG
ncbi:unnamed protein product [Gemmata massiliana]|uniref:Uncharacterized protein n=1 Tax=Gemmata massiliana TaxID=1210884 RepID=A0A6P2CSA2_9BACT|nr:unnamed protein product [Gemmata massiliana]